MSTPPVFAVDGVLRRYGWGSRTAIQHLLGEQPDGRPAAELWFGAHAGDPSPALGTTLEKVVAADPVGTLGPAVADRFDGRLPFLLKVLAADQALSMQVHPTREQARAGYAAEEAAGIPADAPERNYADANHKPELLCALTPFEALCGFRPVAGTLALLDELAIPELDDVAALLRGPDGLRAAFTALLTRDDPTQLVAAVRERATPDGPLRAAYLAAEHFPDDVGIVLTLLLNYVRLEPGEAIYLGAGNVHAYLRGTGVEIMASSDNVLRCGLTPKHVDVPELLRITDFAELAEPRWPADGAGFVVPVPDFALYPVDVAGLVALPGRGPRLVLATTGQVEVDGLTLLPGHAAFVGPGVTAELSGSGRVFLASPGV
jgi:mannose-6-phosphate isomerase